MVEAMEADPVAYTLSRSECFSWQRRQRHLRIGGILGEESLKGHQSSSCHQIISPSSHQIYSYEGGQEEQKAVAGVESDWDPRPLAAI